MKKRMLFQLPNVRSNPHLCALKIKWCNNHTICRKTDKYISIPMIYWVSPATAWLHSLTEAVKTVPCALIITAISCKPLIKQYRGKHFGNSKVYDLLEISPKWLSICLDGLLNHIMGCQNGPFTTEAISGMGRDLMSLWGHAVVELGWSSNTLISSISHNPPLSLLVTRYNQMWAINLYYFPLEI